MKCYKCQRELSELVNGRNFGIELLLFLFFLPGWIIYLIIKPRWVCPFCGEKVLKNKFNKLEKKQ